VKAHLRKLRDDIGQANKYNESEASEYDQRSQKMHAAPVATIAAVDLEIR